MDVVKWIYIICVHYTRCSPQGQPLGVGPVSNNFPWLEKGSSRPIKRLPISCGGTPPTGPSAGPAGNSGGQSEDELPSVLFDQWYYKGNDSSEQGPYDQKRMRNWFNGRYFKVELLIRCDSFKGFYELQKLWPGECGTEGAAFAKEPTWPLEEFYRGWNFTRGGRDTTRHSYMLYQHHTHFPTHIFRVTWCHE